MLVTDIKKDKKHLMRLLLDSGEELLLDKSVCEDNALGKGSTVDEEAVRRLLCDSQYRRAKSRALWYLDQRDYSEKALYEKLTAAGFERETAAQVLAHLTELGLVNDFRFAESFAQRCLDSNISERQTMHKLLEKGISYDTAKEALSHTESDEEAQLTALIEKKYAYKLERDGGYDRVYAALVRRGFSYSAVRQVLKKFTSEIGEEY